MHNKVNVYSKEMFERRQLVILTIEVFFQVTAKDVQYYTAEKILRPHEVDPDFGEILFKPRLLPNMEYVKVTSPSIKLVPHHIHALKQNWNNRLCFVYLSFFFLPIIFSLDHHTRCTLCVLLVQDIFRISYTRYVSQTFSTINLAKSFAFFCIFLWYKHFKSLKMTKKSKISKKISTN